MAPKHVADSWEDDNSDAAEEPVISPKTSSSRPAAAPLSSTFDAAASAWSNSPAADNRSASGDESGSKRPEKTDAVARRMIAAGLGLKAPKQTEEQKAYQKSIREQEKRKKEEERLREQKRREDDEKAKAAMWDD